MVFTIFVLLQMLRKYYNNHVDADLFSAVGLSAVNTVVLLLFSTFIGIANWRGILNACECPLFLFFGTGLSYGIALAETIGEDH